MLRKAILVLQTIGESEPVLKLKNLVDKVAKTESSVLITGENGTGKELVVKRTLSK